MDADVGAAQDASGQEVKTGDDHRETDMSCSRVAVPLTIGFNFQFGNVCLYTRGLLLVHGRHCLKPIQAYSSMVNQYEES